MRMRQHDRRLRSHHPGGRAWTPHVRHDDRRRRWPVAFPVRAPRAPPYCSSPVPRPSFPLRRARR